MLERDTKMLSESHLVNRLIQVAAIIASIIVFTVYINIIVFGTAKNVYLLLAACIMAITILFVLLRGFVEKAYEYAFVALVVTQLFFGYFLMVSFSTWDVSAVLKNAIALANGETINRVYFARYPNNIGILLLLTLILKLTWILFHSHSVYFLVLANICAIDLAIFFAVKVSEEINSKKASYCTGMLMTMFSAYALYVPIVYSDTFVMPFLTGTVYFVFRWTKGKDTRGKSFMLKGFLIGVFLYIGICIKGSLAVLVLAVLVYLAFQFPSKAYFRVASSFLLGLALAAGIWSMSLKEIDLTSQDEQYEHRFPPTHWIMMGMHGAGNYCQDDVDYTNAFSTYDEKKEATIQRIQQMAEEMGFFGAIKQAIKKASQYGWNYGTCYAERYLGDYGDQPLNRSALHEIILSNGVYHKIFWLVTQSYWLLNLGAAFLEILVSIVRPAKRESLIWIAALGFMCFFMIWETHPRYILHFSTLVFILSGNLYCRIGEKLPLASPLRKPH